MGKSRERDHIFDVVDPQNALQVSLESQSKATMGDGAKTPQIQIPVNEQHHHKLSKFCFFFCFVFLTMLFM